MSLRNILFLLAALFSLTLGAKEYKVDEVPMVHLQNKMRYVSNPDGILTNDAVSTMDQMLYRLEQETGVQTIVAVLEDIEGGDCFDFALHLGQRQGVGQKGIDNGLVILLVTGERCIQFVTGYGLEGALPDAICKQIQIRFMNQHFKAGDWNTGMVEGVRAVTLQLDKNVERHPIQSSNDDDGLYILLIMLTFTIVIIIIISMGVWMKRYCHKCKKFSMKAVSTHTISRIEGIRTEETTYVCSRCGHIKTVRNKIHEDNNHHHRGSGPFRGGIFMGGMGGFGGHGGGGFSGGSFGGGSFGGGGAGSRF